MKNEKKKNLITDFSKLNYKPGSNLVFPTEYLFHLYKKENLKKYNCAFVNKISFYQNVNHKNKDYYLKKKLRTYRKEMAKLLNNFHKTNYSLEYWGLIMDFWLLKIIDSLQMEIKLLKNVKKKFKNIYAQNFFCDKFFFDSSSSDSYVSFDQNYQKLARSLIAKEIGFKVIKKCISDDESDKSAASNSIVKKLSFSDFISNFLSFFFRTYVFLFKPAVILEGYFGKKNIIKIFFKSLGRIVFLNSRIFFYKKKYFFKINTQLRNKIKVKEKDLLDKIFNLLVGKLFPVTFLEGFDFIRKQNLFFAKRISKIGTGVNIAFNDQFNFLTAEILRRKGKLLLFQHGGCISEEVFSSQEIVEKKYSTKRYLWTNPKGLGQNFLTRYKKISFLNIKNNKRILIYPTINAFRDNLNSTLNLKRNNHPYLNQNYDFFEYLNQRNKNNSKVKLFPSKDSADVKKIWKKKFGNSVNFGETYSSEIHFYKSRLVVINDINTPLYELMYIGIPFIIIMDSKFNEYKVRFAKHLKQLEKLSVLYRCPKKAAKFVNKNYDEITDWWKIVSKEKNFINLKNNLFIEKSDYINSITKELITI